MKAVILAGGLGTRISEESEYRPKPMIEIGGMPILWHIMKIYSQYDITDFIVCCGYKANIIKEFFAGYYLKNSDVTFDFFDNNRVRIHKQYTEPWRVTLVDTKVDTMTGGRIKRIKDYLEDESFMLTYGDGVADINITELLETHKKGGKLATITAVQPESRFGFLDISECNIIKSFREKAVSDVGWINGGFMVLEKSVIDYIQDDQTVFEREPLETLAEMGELQCYKHHGFWHCMDTMRDKKKLETLWRTDKAPWKVW